MVTTERESVGADLIHEQPTAMAMAREALDLVGRDPTAAAAAAGEAAAAGRARRDAAAVAVSLRAQSLADQALGRTKEALAAGRAAVRAATRSGQANVEAEARMSLAFVLLERGQVPSALAEADRAAGMVTGLLGARVATQRALVLQRAGRHREALAGYAAALPVLRRAGDSTWEARLRNNRGLVHAYHGSLRDAEADLRRAMDLYERSGAELLVAGSLWNLGFVAARQGDVPTALQHYDEANELYRKLGQPMPQLLIDRAEVLLGAGVFDEARWTAERAVRELADAALSSYLAEAYLQLAQAALATGDVAAGRQAAGRAAQLFTRQERAPWAVVARHAAVRAAEREGVPSRRLLHDALATADELASAGWPAHELDMRLTAATVATALNDLATARDQLQLTISRAVGGSLQVSVRACYAEALLRLQEGDPSAADRCLRKGSDLLARARATVGATELRMHVSNHGRDIHGLGLRLAVGARSARRVLAWSERSRAAALRLRPVLPPRDEGFAAALADLRRAAAEVERAHLSGEPIEELRRRAARLETRVRQHARRARGSWADMTSLPSMAELCNALGQRVLVELAEAEGRLVGVTLKAGRARLHHLGPSAPIVADAAALRTALRRLATAPDGRLRDRATAALRQAASRLDARLLLPLSTALGDSPVVLSPVPTLQSVPWSLLPGLVGRPVTVTPSATSWLIAHQRGASARSDVLAIAGPGLPAAEAEVGQVARERSGARVLAGPDATAGAVLTAMEGVGCVHIAAHGRLRSDNSLLSSLEMADGPLTIYDLERLGSPPRLVVLPACQSGAAATTAGDEVMGLAHALLAIGSSAVIAAVLPVADNATRQVMVALHRRLNHGETAAAALVGARHDVADDSAAAMAAASFVCFGAGH